MVRVRLLAGAAVLVAAVALPSTTSAQIGPCPILQPPPCIVFDGSKAVESAAELANKTKQLASLAERTKELASIQGALGKLKAPGMGGYGAMAPIAPTTATTLSAASASIDARMRPISGTSDQAKAQSDANRLVLRSAAGDGYAVAQATKQRVDKMRTDAEALRAEAESLGTDVRTDWQINARAKALMLRALLALREVQSARTSLEAVVQLAEQDGHNVPPSFQYADAAPAVPSETPAWGASLGRISDLTNELQALQTAKQLSSSYRDSIQGFRDTQSEYQTVLNAAQQAQAVVQNHAARDAAASRTSADRIMSVVDANMQRFDQTAWDDPNKAKAADAAANRASRALSKQFRRISGGWTADLDNRAEAYKQESFFRPINEDAKAGEADAIKSLADFEQSVGFPIGDEAAIDRKIVEVQAQLKQVGTGLDDAPEPVKAQRDAIYASTMKGSDYDGGTPSTAVIDLGDREIDPGRYGYEGL